MLGDREKECDNYKMEVVIKKGGEIVFFLINKIIIKKKNS